MIKKPEVIIDGVKYLPAKKVILNSKDFKKALIGLFWGNASDSTIDKHENGLYIEVTDEPQYENSPTVAEFINGLDLDDFKK